MSNVIFPALALVHAAPEFWAALSPIERLRLRYMYWFWLRPEQRAPEGVWKTWLLVAGRGWGKTYAAAAHVCGLVRRGKVSIALAAPSEERAQRVQIDTLLALSPPWTGAERFGRGMRWANGSTAEIFTPIESGRARGGNFDLSWGTELVDWQANGREDLWSNLTFATRVGVEQMIADTTSKGNNPLILRLIADHHADPESTRLTRGTIHDNPLLSAAFLKNAGRRFPKGSRRYREEMLGEVFSEAGGALWEQAWIDDARRDHAPEIAQTIVGLDPAYSTREGSDPTGIVVCGRDRMGELYVLRDLTGIHEPADWSDIVVAECARGACGVVVEVNRGTNTLTHAITMAAQARGMTTVQLERDRPFPNRQAGRIFIREVHTAQGKGERAYAPARMYQDGRVHHVGSDLERLEYELTTWEPGTPTSPNRLDACCYALTELAGLVAPIPAADIAGAAAVNAELQRRATVWGASRGVGLGAGTTKRRF